MRKVKVEIKAPLQKGILCFWWGEGSEPDKAKTIVHLAILNGACHIGGYGDLSSHGMYACMLHAYMCAGSWNMLNTNLSWSSSINFPYKSPYSTYAGRVVWHNSDRYIITIQLEIWAGIKFGSWIQNYYYK